MQRKEQISPNTYSSNDLYYRLRSRPATNSVHKVTQKYKTDDLDVALRRAAFKGNWEDIEILVESGADVKSTSTNGFSALDWAYKNGHLTAVDTLCWLKSDQSILKPLLSKYVSIRESEWPKKEEAAFRAVESDNLDDLKILVERYGVDVMTKNKNGFTLKQLSILREKQKTTSWLTEKEDKFRSRLEM